MIEADKKPKKGYGPKALIMVAIVALVAGVSLTANFDVTSIISAETIIDRGDRGGGDFWQEGGVALASSEAPVPGAPKSFVELAKELSPTVVNISTTQVLTRDHGRQGSPFSGNPFDRFFGGDDFFGEEFRKFFGAPDRERDRPRRSYKTQSLGSGFVINEEGYIITNYHVIERATEIKVSFSNGKRKKRSYPAEIIGGDALLDIALIKIEPEKGMPVAILGDSDTLEIGEWVVAIGNPFGLGGTVTAGIVSQKGRVLGAGPYDNFIQTDASINPGNSGGPLFNLKGEVVGINTAIIAGGSGIGFAIPINMAKDVVMQLKSGGKVVRGWIGVNIQEVTPELAESFGLKETRGALVSSVAPGDPADKAGIKAGDIIVEFNGKLVSELHDLPRIVAATAPGKSIKVVVVRDGVEKKLSIVVAKKKEFGEEASGPGSDNGKGDDKDKVDVKEYFGIRTETMTPELSLKLGIEEGAGVVITAVEDASAADEAGLMTGDLIVEVNREAVETLKDFGRLAKKAQKKHLSLILIKRGEQFFFVTIKTLE